MNLLILADQQCSITVDPHTRRPNASIPGHLPMRCSLRYLFTYCLDIRRSPGRPLLRVLAESTSDDGEKRRLLELCSAQGVGDFTRFVRQAGISLADLLFAFPSCRPEVDRLLEQLPRLLPRPYTIASVEERWGHRLRFIYSQLHFPADDGRRYARDGLCSQWLSGLTIGDNVKVMLKEPARFRLPPLSVSLPVKSMDIPLLMIGPGAGIAPFLAFVQRILWEQGEEKKLSVTRWLLFGCRRLDVDYIYRDEMEGYKREGLLTELTICESQPRVPGHRPVYVQDALKEQADKVVDFLSSKGPNGEPSRIYLCGDAKGMSKDVNKCFIDIFQQGMGKTEQEAKDFMSQLKAQDRYIEDVWA